MNARTIGTLAGLGGFTAAVALLTGLSAARADDQSDGVRQRIDQLAQATQGGANPSGYVPAMGATAPPPGTPAGAGSFPRSFLIPGTDTSIRVGGQAQVDVLYYFTGLAPVSGTGLSGFALNQNNPGGTSNDVAIPLNFHGQIVNGVAAAASISHSRSSAFYITAKESKINVETRTPTAWGEARSFVELDFQQPNNATGPANPNQVSSSYTPRLRYAYATLGGLLGGQANSNFSDSDSGAELLDFGGSTGASGPSRHGQVRYTVPAGSFLSFWPLGGAFSVAIEDPATDGVTPLGYVQSDTQINNGLTGCTAQAGTFAAATGTFTGTGISTPACIGAATLNNPMYVKAPDLTFAYHVPQPWGHFNWHNAVRWLSINDGRFVNRDYLGWGTGIGADVKPGWFGWAKDDIAFGFHGGDGIGYYISDAAGALSTNYMFAPATAAQAATVRARTNWVFGGHLSYQHWWTSNLRSTADYSIVHTDVSSILTGAQRVPGTAAGAPASFVTGQNNASNKEIQSVHVNLIWSPVAFVDMGVEYMHAKRKVVSNITGESNSLQAVMRVKF